MIKGIDTIIALEVNTIHYNNNHNSISSSNRLVKLLVLVVVASPALMQLGPLIVGIERDTLPIYLRQQVS